MDFILSKEENEALFHFGLAVNVEARNRFLVEDLIVRANAGITSRQTQFASLLADAFNGYRSHASADFPAARSGEVLALMLLHEVYRHLIALHSLLRYPRMLADGLTHVRETLGQEQTENVFTALMYYYPLRPMSGSGMSSTEYLAGSDGRMPNIERILWEIMILQVDHENPALQKYRELFDDAAVCAHAPLREFMHQFDLWLQRQPPSPDTNLTLLETLREPARACPGSLEGQIEYIMDRWRSVLPPLLFEQWLIARGIMREETLYRGHGGGPAYAPSFTGEEYAEPEAFTPDEDWMPKVVLLAKLAYVWLDQLSRKYGRRLSYLSDIPDAELDLLARWGFNGLWLIGVWERSPASQEIKQRMGNPEAAASAYSLYDYTIAQDLGGEAALQDLARRARQRGIRLAGDMVPNHMGLYSKWVIEHPERFLQVDIPPFPAYSFSGPDLSKDERVGLFIEEGYWTNRDAAVVFKRTDKWTGGSVYIYHGNDGTSMPWNDTAQLNFLRQDTREAVIQTIIQVARRFPIIRFDAAMTLAKRHYQRLWFPKPGDGGAIPSRAAFGVSKQDFDQVFPMEFWREVVDRIAAEAPDTLLLAEAFWLMEGYFVRTLGMHRVYNSAFMNMLKMEDNSKYRQTIKNVLEFTPEVLQRFVNFMNNPDEDTAEAQFGKGDKYFGVAAMLVTMPGLPMFGHGQVEGFTEKYGMEYRRAYRDEPCDEAFMERHEREIFPLMRKRYLFSDARNFALFDFTTVEGWVDENVFAYSNRCDGEHALMVYNNAYTTTRGVLHTSTATNVGKGEERILERRSLLEALDLDKDPRAYVIWRDMRTGLEYLHHCNSLTKNGIHLELHAYEYKAFFFIRRLYDTDNSWGRLHGQLKGMGVPSIQEAYLEMHLAGILEPFRNFMTPDMIRHVLLDNEEPGGLGPHHALLMDFLKAINTFLGSKNDVASVVNHIERKLAVLRKIMRTRAGLKLPKPVLQYLRKNLPDDTNLSDAGLAFWRVPLAFCLLRAIGVLHAKNDADSAAKKPQRNRKELYTSPAEEKTSGRLMREWLLIKQVAKAFEALDGNTWQAWRDGRLVSVCLAHRVDMLSLETEIWGPVLYDLFESDEMRQVLMTHWHAGRRYINKEQLERSLLMLLLVNLIMLDTKKKADNEKFIECYENMQDILLTASDTGYDINFTVSVLK
ncbi:MAG: Alpha amylase, catalytic domain [Candidatus Hydrogenedentes bacterium ADurb.Bin101]|nr:MAG: Alpha amylase, catalytic domain [Candidatus Hydrogenedentes bacterium ADurb.Bin101]